MSFYPYEGTFLLKVKNLRKQWKKMQDAALKAGFVLDSEDAVVQYTVWKLSRPLEPREERVVRYGYRDAIGRTL